MLNLECVGGCGKVIINANIDLSGHDVAGTICPDCGKAHPEVVDYDENLQGFALLSQAEFDALKKV